MSLRTPSHFSHTIKAFVVFAIIAISSAPFVVLARDRSTPAAPIAPQIQIVGASVMLRLQREGAPIYDFRVSGQAIPGAIRVTKNSFFKNASQLVFLGDGEASQQATAFAQRNPKAHIYLVPSRFVAAYPNFKSVQQIEPRAAYRLMKQSNADVFDFAESEEFAYARVAGSTRIDWTSVLRNDLSAIEKSNQQNGRPILLICPVGSRSQLVTQKLKRAGIRVLNVRGGMFAWQNARLPIEGLSAQRSTRDAK